MAVPVSGILEASALTGRATPSEAVLDDLAQHAGAYFLFRQSSSSVIMVITRVRLGPV